MMYTDLYTKQRGNPSYLLIGVAVIIGIGFFALLFSTRSQIPTRASKKVLVRHEKVNVSARTAGIFWQSEKKETGWIVYGQTMDKVTKIALDERDIADSKTPSYYHYVMLRNLDPDTTYYYKIISGDELSSLEGGVPFQLHTVKAITTAAATKPAFGKVLLPNSEPANNAIILLYYKNAYPLLSLSKVTGEWLIPLQYTVDKYSNQVQTLTDTDKVKMEVLNDDYTSHIEALVNKINPFEQSVVLGKDYVLLQEDNVLGAVANKATSTTKSSDISIIFPKDGAVIPGTKPLIKGVGTPGIKLTISVNTNPQYAFLVVPDSQGEWDVDFPVIMNPGSYTVTATGKNKQGETVMARNSFTIAKSGQQVLGESTASGKLTPTTTPAVTSIVSPTVSSLTTPTTMPNTGGGQTGTLSATLTATPPVTGDNHIPFILGSFALIVIGAGLMFVF
ncbi:hypothetical protein HGA88_03025 [Candidatus Roizmanbacteria bacterium]|nr:hypothetical protein [Candidatus Roizmanbacteria bacterium]